MFRVLSWRKSGWYIPAAVLALTVLAYVRAVLPAVRPAGVAPSVTLPIVMYHGITDDPAQVGPYVIPASLFAEDMAYLQAQGYTAVTMTEVLAYVDEGTPLPSRPIMLTFDDGYYNNYLYAYPVLKQYGMRAVIAPIVRWSAFYSDTPGQQNRPVYSHLTWDQIREMAADGTVEFQSHSYDLHDTSRRRGIRRRKGESRDAYTRMLREDLRKAQTLLTEKAGVTPTTFVYPFGATDSWALPVLRELGFRATFSCESRLNRLTRDPECLYGLGRYLRTPDTDSATFFDSIEE